MTGERKSKEGGSNLYNDGHRELELQFERLDNRTSRESQPNYTSPMYRWRDPTTTCRVVFGRDVSEGPLGDGGEKELNRFEVKRVNILPLLV